LLHWVDVQGHGKFREIVRMMDENPLNEEADPARRSVSQVLLADDRCSVLQSDWEKAGLLYRISPDGRASSLFAKVGKGVGGRVGREAPAYPL
jgi:hypothetical protein